MWFKNVFFSVDKYLTEMVFGQAIADRREYLFDSSSRYHHRIQGKLCHHLNQGNKLNCDVIETWDPGQFCKGFDFNKKLRKVW
jgi:hypothetical protein